MCASLFLVFKNLVDNTLTSSHQSIANCNGFVTINDEHDDHTFRDLILFISLYNIDYDAMVMDFEIHLLNIKIHPEEDEQCYRR